VIQQDDDFRAARRAAIAAAASGRPTAPTPTTTTSEENDDMPRGIPTCKKCGESGHQARTCGKRKNGAHGAAGAASADPLPLALTALLTTVQGALDDAKEVIREAVEEYAREVGAEQRQALQEKLAAMLEATA
jgi:hypothetical protein